MARPQFHPLPVRDIRRESAGAVSIAFAVPHALAGDYAFAPGQYLTLRATIDGEDLRRSYSICSGPDEGELRVAVKQVAQGVFSNWVNDTLKPGDTVDVMTPTGRFGLAHAPGDGRVHVGFAAGSGITPILSIVRGVLAREPQSRFFLFYGNRTARDILFRQELEDLKDRYMGRFALFHVLSQEEQDLPVLNGRLDADRASLLLRSMVGPVDHVFVCGPIGMNEDLEQAFRELGIPPDHIHVELFVSSAGGKPRPRPAPPPPQAPPAHLASIILDGKRREVPVAEGEAILDAASRAGMDLPFACRGGMCCTCRARLVSGTAEMAVNYSLEPWEMKAGFVLTCQAHPTSEQVTVDFDQV